MFPAISDFHHLPYQNFNQAPLFNKAGYTATPVPCGGGVIIWTGAVRPKTAKKPKTCKCDGPMDGRMDRPTNKASCNVA